MPLLVPAASENLLCAFILGTATPNDQLLKLFVSDTTPADTDTAATYTEMSTLGYAAKTLTMSNWTIAQNASNVAEGVYADQTFVFTAGTPVAVHGYFVVDSVTGLLLWAERLPTAITVQNNGDDIIVPPRFTLSKVV